MQLPGTEILQNNITSMSNHIFFKTSLSEDRRRDGKTISKSEQEWILPAQLGQLKTGQGGKGLLQIHLWTVVPKQASKVMG